MPWHIKKFEELTNSEMYNIIKERINIFVVEQNCPYPELDDYDQKAIHMFEEVAGEIIGYCRILPSRVKYRQASIGRVIVKKSYRRGKKGSELVAKAIEYVQNNLDETEIKIQAQDHLRNFYGSFGFEPISEVYLEDAIPHVDMLLTCKATSSK